MKDQITITARIPINLGGDVAAIAGALQRPRSWVIEEAIREYVTREKAFLEAVEEGLRADEAGELVDHAEVAAELDAVIAKEQKKRA